MVRKIAIALIVLGIAAFSPAPINQAKGPRTFHPEQTQEQIAQQQRFNGSMPVVGQVPRVVDELGNERAPYHGVEHDGKGESSLSVGTQNADKVGAITRATQRVEAEEKQSRMLWIWGLLIAVGGFGAWKLVQYKIEQSTPVPEFSKRMLKEIENGRI